ncbi:glutamate--tRNA ligase [Granulosicoccus antarcticus]|uniref:Glutamate--tRNA ligase n=1 Tax=Granulosicoccus antarcticus IMCC3135 TaxID=1192854 RepID=A0A2Z2P0L2_9GAMM|nr:glutamate--tRNA ligase [Granulosicoccus antarcticus]ASJ75851.1 Glutamate--tRNA ligase [Granulosicoccus antarcticus IMCC3135]
MKVRTRFAPSPTGYLHIGGARTALFSYLFARKHGGEFVLRIEDTDLERSSDESVQAILDSMEWLGLEYDEGPFYQTKRFDRYREAVKQLMDAGHAYYCYCTPEELNAMREEAMAKKEKPRYNGYWRGRTDTPPAGIKPVVRFANPLEGKVTIEDGVKGPIVIDNKELDDLVIMRSDGTPTYNLTVVVDDMDMEITHVIRGDDHINNTPRQINILEALGGERPVYAHLPMILGEDGKRMSKRHGAVSVMQYKDDGFLPEALLNYLVRLGWSHQDQEIFTSEEMRDLFTLEACNRSGSVFDDKKLEWVNQQYFHKAEASHLGAALQPYMEKLSIDTSKGAPLSEVANILRDRAKTLVEMAESARYFYEAPQSYDSKAEAKQFKQASADVLLDMSTRFKALESWDAASIQSAMEACVEALEIGFGKLGQPLRLAVTGGTQSPAMNDTVALIDRAEIEARLLKAIEICRQAVA